MKKIFTIYPHLWASLVAQTAKRLPTMWETQVQSLGREDPLEKEMATHSSIHAQRIPWTEEPGGATVHAVAKSRTRLCDFSSAQLSLCFWLLHTFCSLEILHILWIHLSGLPYCL